MFPSLKQVEPPGNGDSTRGLAPYVTFAPDKSMRSSYFAAVNAGKPSISLDLKKDADRAVFEKLLALADVLVENYKPGVMASLGFDWQAVHHRFPSLIMASISGFGQTGPQSGRRALDTVIQAGSGLMSVTGFADREPVRVGASFASSEFSASQARYLEKPCIPCLGLEKLDLLHCADPRVF